MIHLNYKTNKELVKEMQRILPDFEFENLIGKYSTQTRHLFEYYMEESDFKFSENGNSYIEAVHPTDIIRFLQDERVRKIVHEYRRFDPRVISTHLIYSYEIFLSSENFQRGVEDELLPELKKTK